jgi:hypothetical protein
MRPRHADVLKELGYEGRVEEFGEALAAVKAEAYPDTTDEEVLIGKVSSSRYCVLVRKRLNASRLTRAFILRSLLGIRKNGLVRRAASVLE